MLSIPTALLTVGFAYALGIVVALVVCSATSGGHFSPAVTVVHVLYNGFPIIQGIRSAKGSLKKGLPLTHNYEDTSLLRYSVALPPVCLYIGNGRLSLRLARVIVVKSARVERLLIISAGRRGGAPSRKQVRGCELLEPWARWHLRIFFQSCGPYRPGFLERICIGMIPS